MHLFQTAISSKCKNSSFQDFCIHERELCFSIQFYLADNVIYNKRLYIVQNSFNMQFYNCVSSFLTVPPISLLSVLFHVHQHWQVCFNNCFFLDLFFILKIFYTLMGFASFWEQVWANMFRSIQAINKISDRDYTWFFSLQINCKVNYLPSNYWEYIEHDKNNEEKRPNHITIIFIFVIRDKSNKLIKVKIHYKNIVNISFY